MLGATKLTQQSLDYSNQLLEASTVRKTPKHAPTAAIPLEKHMRSAEVFTKDT
jgi:hypothetical protein